MFFPNIIKGFSEENPNIRIELSEEETNTVINLVSKGELDFGIIMLPVDENEFDIIPLTKDKLMLCLQKSHPLAKRSGVSILDIKKEPMILFTEDFTMHDRIIQECNSFGFQPNIAYKSSQWDFIKDMVEKNLGITFFPESISRKIDHNIIISVPIINPPISWEIGIIVKKRKHRSYATQAFIDYILYNGL